MIKSNWKFAIVLSLAALMVASTARMAMAQATSQPSEKAAVKAPSDPIEDFINKTKNPIPDVLSWGADFRLRWEYFNNNSLDKHGANHENSYMRYRPRWWVKVTPIKDLEFNLKLTWEGRSWCENELIEGWDQDRDQVLFDQLVREIQEGVRVAADDHRRPAGPIMWAMAGSPATARRWTAPERFFVDGVRFEYDSEDIKTNIDVMYFEADAQWDHWFPRIANKQVPALATEQDEQGVMVYVTNKSLGKTQIDGYFFYKHNEHEMLPLKGSGARRRSGDDADIYTFGTRVAGEITSNWKYRGDIAGQFGHREGQAICASWLE